MSIDPPGPPGYPLGDLHLITTRKELKAAAHPLRDTILDLLLERSASVRELAAALTRPSSTVAHHVGVLHDAGLITVVSTRRVRAVQERRYGRTARVYYVGPVLPEGVDPERDLANLLGVAHAESIAAHRDDDLRAILQHARIPRDRVREFWGRVQDLAREFGRIPREGDVVYGFAAGLYPTAYPQLPVPDSPESATD